MLHIYLLVISSNLSYIKFSLPLSPDSLLNLSKSRITTPSWTNGRSPNLVDTYGNEIQKGDWISVKGRISTYSKDVERDGRTFKDKVVEILGFEITDRTHNKVYTSDGEVHELNSNEVEENNDMER